MYRKIVFAALSVAFMLGCSSHHTPDTQSILSRMLYSPNGEPLNGGPLGRPTCEEALSHWFERIDIHHGGTISRDEFMADAQVQFRRMDIDGNGYLVSEEVERFRQPYRQQPASEVIVPEQKADQPQQDKRKRASKHKHNDDNDENSQSSDSSDPVMAADTDLDFRVTSDEFMAHAQKVFATLDSNQDNVLSRDEVLARCPKK